MFNFKDLGDMSKIAQEAKNLQKQSDENQRKMIKLLEDVLNQLKEIKTLLK